MAFLLLLSVTMPLFFFVGFLVKQKLVQHEMEERLEDSFLQTITVHVSEFLWVKKNKEVIINGKLFDVKSSTRNGNQITFTGLYDEDEDKLKEDFANIIHRRTTESTPFDQLILKYIFTAVLSKAPATAIISDNKCTKPVYYFFDETIVSGHLSIITPPHNI